MLKPELQELVDAHAAALDVVDAANNLLQFTGRDYEDDAAGAWDDLEAAVGKFYNSAGISH